MQHMSSRRSTAGPALLGVVLVAVGVVAIAAREADLVLFPGLGTWGWPLFIIIPGVVLLAASLVPTPPAGIGFAIAGAVVTTVGGVLLYGSQTGHWESWAYAWALIPFAVGAALFLYGLFARSASMVRAGEWVGGIAAVAFIVGAWFFEGLFAGADRSADALNSWPIALVALGVLLALWAMLRPAASDVADPAPHEPQIH